MNTLLVFTVLFAGACMADVSHIVGQPPVAILSSHQDLTPDGAWTNGFASENGIAVESEGTPDGQSHGSYSYPGPDGKNIKVDWTAGRDGFIATGDSIPATPDAIVRAVEYNKAHPYVEPTKP